MKKTLALLFSLVMLAVPALYALSEIPEESEAALDFPPPIGVKEHLLDGPSRSDLPATEHKVTVAEDGTFTITVSSATFSVQLPFGYRGFTQDLLAQLDDYLNTFKDPRNIVEQLILMEIALLVADLNTGDELQVLVVSDGLSELLVDTGPEEVFKAFADRYLVSVPEGSQREAVVINGRGYLKSTETLSEDSSALAYLTVYGGHKFLFRTYGDGEGVGEAEADALLELIEAMKYL